MIGKISGRLELKASDHVMIDTGGVGYIVFCSERTLAMLPPSGEAVALYTDLVVREDLLQLYGFATIAEREWHKLLISVQGVGAKAALAIQGTLGADGVSRAITLGDAAAIKAAPGVGPKIAQRVCLELKDKAPAIMAMGTGGAQTAAVADGDVRDTPAPSAPVASAPIDAGAQADALSALGNLGYAPADAARAVAEAAGEAPDADAPALIRMALQRLAPAG
jgi:Holliday junction DNA helicase RuvA